MRRGVATLGLSSWDRFVVTDAYPGPGEYAIVRHQFEQSGGTTANTSAALARLGIPVTFVSAVGDDSQGAALINDLRDAGCNVEHMIVRENEPSDTGIIVISGAEQHRDRTIFWIQGAKPVMGDLLPVPEMLDHQWVMLDVDDPRLRNFFLDLPAHQSPRTKLFGTMTYLVEMGSGSGWGHVLRHDAVCGNVRELRALTGEPDLDAAFAKARADLVASACRALYISHGANGAYVVRADGITHLPAFSIEPVDTTGAGDAFAAGCLWGLLDRCSDEEIVQRGNALGALACRALGARASQPTMDEALALVDTVGAPR
ncbi:MAG: carbohydrate kinase family protein [Thermomicrobiales bacterium]|nr:carbohydrate kinase family protein [Thermomicrobiales bacterium]